MDLASVLGRADLKGIPEKRTLLSSRPKCSDTKQDPDCDKTALLYPGNCKWIRTKAVC